MCILWTVNCFGNSISVNSELSLVSTSSTAEQPQNTSHKSSPDHRHQDVLPQDSPGQHLVSNACLPDKVKTDWSERIKDLWYSQVYTLHQWWRAYGVHHLQQHQQQQDQAGK